MQQPTASEEGLVACLCSVQPLLLSVVCACLDYLQCLCGYVFIAAGVYITYSVSAEATHNVYPED